MDDLRAQLTDRLVDLDRERLAGEQRLAELEREHWTIQQTLQRIGGAVQVIRETLEANPVQEPEPAAPAEIRLAAGR